MKKNNIIIALCVLTVTTISSVATFADRDSDDDDTHDRTLSGFSWMQPRADIQTQPNEQYLNECGACHFAYQPGLLPQASWARIMGSLENHFGDDASLDPKQTSEIRRFLLSYSADLSNASRSRAFAAGASSGAALPRITQTRYFRRKHSEIPDRIVTKNQGVGSFSNCQACHQGAEQGYYDESQIRIPGIGRWED